MNIVISFPSQGQIRLQSRELFTEPGNETCRQLLERVFQALEITDVTINRLQPMTGTGPDPQLGSRPGGGSMFRLTVLESGRSH
jgi:hypothetical protein